MAVKKKVIKRKPAAKKKTATRKPRVGGIASYVKKIFAAPAVKTPSATKVSKCLLMPAGVIFNLAASATAVAGPFSRIARAT